VFVELPLEQQFQMLTGLICEDGELVVFGSGNGRNHEGEDEENSFRWFFDLRVIKFNS